MKIVITNDDGYDEPGLDTLKKALMPLGQVIVVAPKHPQSNAGHRVTLREIIRVKKLSPDKYIVDGSPADCTRLALKHFVPDTDWLIAGINPGANLGSDVYQSGTVAAAREAAILGYPAIAVSQYIALDHSIDWDATGYHAAKILSKQMSKKLIPGQFLNINLPHPINKSSAIHHEFCMIDTNPHIYDFHKEDDGFRYQGTIHNRPRTSGRDVDICFSGKISIAHMEI